MPTPLLAGARPPFPGLAGLQDLMRPGWPPGAPPLQPFPGMPTSIFDKGDSLSLTTLPHSYQQSQPVQNWKL